MAMHSDRRAGSGWGHSHRADDGTIELAIASKGSAPMNYLPAEVTAYLSFLQDVQSIAVSAAQESVVGWVVAIAAAGGCIWIARGWAVYSVISGFLLFYGLGTALETLRQSLPA